MKKSLIAILLAAVIVFCCACTGSKTENTSEKADTAAVTETEASTESADTADDTEKAPEDTGEALAKTTDDSFAVVFSDGTAITLGAEADSVLSMLPEPLEVTEAPNCVRVGTDRIYTFDGFTVTTNPDEAGVDRVINVTLVTDAIVLENRIMIGSTLKDLEKAYGTEYEDNFGALTFKLEKGVTLSAVMTDDIVTSLTFSVEI